MCQSCKYWDGAEYHGFLFFGYWMLEMDILTFTLNKEWSSVWTEMLPVQKAFIVTCSLLSEHCSPVCQTVSWLPQMETFKLYYKCWVSKCTYCTNLQTVCFKSGQRKWKIVSDHPCTIKHCYTHTILMSVWWFFKLWFIELSWLNTVTLLLGNYCRILGWNW